MNEFAPSPNISPVTHPQRKLDEKRFAPWFWPDNELADALHIRQAAFLKNQKRVLHTANNNPEVQAASQQLLNLQAHYLSEHFPEKYTIEQSRTLGKVIINRASEDKIDTFSIDAEKSDWHPLAISGMLGQEDICIVKRKKSGRQVLVAGFLATPTNWNLSDFMKADMDTIHQHVSGYDEPVSETRKYKLKDTVDKVLESLREYPDGVICRNNQFIEYADSLALEPSEAKKIKAHKIAKNLGSRIFLRTERETLARLPKPYDNFTIFTIKPHVFHMADVRRLRGDDFARAVLTNSVLESALKMTESESFNFTNPLQQYLTSTEESKQ